MLAAPLDVSAQRQTWNYSLGSPNSDVNGVVTYLRGGPQNASLGGLSSGVCYQTAAIAQPAVPPLSPISPASAVQHHSPPWPVADANFSLQCPPRTNLAAAAVDVAVVKDPTPPRPIFTHSVGLYSSNSRTGYPSPPNQCSRSDSHDCHCEPPKAPESYSSPGSASDIHTSLVSPPHSLIGQRQSTTTLRRGEPGLFPSLRNPRQAPGITVAAYSQTPSPASSTNTPRPIDVVSGSRRNSTPTSPHSGKLHKRTSAQPPPPVRKHSSRSTVGDLPTTQQVAESKKGKIRAYHREVGARNRQKEKEERRRFELQSQWLEKVNMDLVAEERSLVTEKMVLVNELFHHSLCCSHGDVKEYLTVESNKIVRRAKSRFLE